MPVGDLDGACLLDDPAHASHRVGISGHIAIQLHARDELLIRLRNIRVCEL